MADGSRSRSDLARAQSVADGGTAVAHEVRDSRALEVLARCGLAVRGVVYLLIASIAVQVAIGRTSTSADQNGAIQDVASRPFGKLLLIIVAVGLAGYALWRLSVAVVGNPGDQGASAVKRVGRRLGALATGVAYAVLCVTTIRVITGGPGSSSTRQQQSITAWLLGLPMGRALVIAIGVAVVIGACGLVWWAASLRFERNLATEKMGAAMRGWSTGLGAAGIGVGGIVVGLVGVFLAKAGIANDAAASKGLDQTLRTVAVAPFGRLLLVVIAAGLAAYGLYSFIEARYRRV